MKNANAPTIGLLFTGTAPTSIEWEGGRAVIRFKKPAPPSIVHKRMPVSLLAGSRVDQSRWPDPAHLAFVNLDLQSQKRVEWFLRTYGISERFFREWTSEKAFIDLATLRDLQVHFRLIWRAANATAGSNPLTHLPSGTALKSQAGRVWLVTDDLWVVMEVGSFLDTAQNRLKICRLSDCKLLPYFIKARADAEFCSGKCRSIFYMRERRKNPALREIDNARRRKTPKKRGRHR